MKKLSALLVSVSLLLLSCPNLALSQEIPTVTDILFSSVNRKTREQKITVTGSALPSSLSMLSDACDNVITVSKSQEKAEFSCTLKNVISMQVNIVDGAGQQLKSVTHNIVEIYGAKAGEELQCLEKKITISGVNLPDNLSVSAPKCQSLVKEHGTDSTLEYECKSCGQELPTLNNIRLTVKNAEGLLLFQGTPKSLSVVKKQTPLASKKTKKKKGSNKKPEVDDIQESEPLKTGQTVLINSSWLRLVCDSSVEDQEGSEELLLGSCEMTSPFIRKAVVDSSLLRDSVKKFSIVKAVVEGDFETRLGQTIDSLTQKLGGLKINPVSGHALFSLDIPDQSMLLSGDIKGIGIDASALTGFPLDFNLVDYSGELLLVYPVFNIQKSREQSKVIFGMGKVPGQQMTILRGLRENMREKIQSRIIKANSTLNERSRALGNKLASSLGKNIFGNGARATTLQLFKGLEVVPETIAFYDNFDFIGKVKLKSEPFRPSSWGKNSAWPQVSLASMDMDLSAKDARLVLKGGVLNNISILSTDLIKPGQGLLNAELVVDLKKDGGSIHLDPVELRLPGDFAKVDADVHVIQIFHPKDLAILGRLKSGITVYGIELAKANASLHYDPNAVYQMGDFKTVGLLDIGAQMKVVAVRLDGRAVFTHPENQLAMDMGGRVSLDFLGYEKELASALSRSRISRDFVRTCINAETGKVTIHIPLLDEINLQGGVSLDVQENFSDRAPGQTHLAISGQGTDNFRLGFNYNAEKLLINPYAWSKWSEKCTDAPGIKFLDQIAMTKSEVADVPHIPNTLLASSNPSNEILAQAFSSSPSPAKEKGSGDEVVSSTHWDINGWKIIEIPADQQNELVIVDAAGQEVSLQVGSFKIPGLWKFEHPLRYALYSEDAFSQAGYHFAVKKNSGTALNLKIGTYTNDQESKKSFEIGNLNPGQNSVDIGNVEAKGTIRVNDQNIVSKSIEQRSITPDELKVKAEVSNLQPGTRNQKPANPFSDLKSPQLKEAITYLLQQNIITGYPDGTFRPDQVVNRAEAMKMLYQTKRIPAQEQGPGTFKIISPFVDVQAQAWYSIPVIDAFKAGIVKGYMDGKFKPNHSVNTVEFIKMAMLTEKDYSAVKNHRDTLRRFKDLDAKAWYMPFVSFAAKKNYLAKSIRLKPSSNLTRAEAALILYRMLKAEDEAFGTSK